MRQLFPLSSPFERLPAITARRAFAVLAALFAIAVAIAIGGRMLVAQVEGDRGIAAVAASTDIEIGEIEVDVRGDNAAEAREEGWREAQRLAWAKLDGPELSDSQLDSIVSSIVIEKERVGPKRYIATLGVIFDRTRTGQYLSGQGRAAKSAPMMLLPITITGGAMQVYEQRSPWQRAWAEYQSGASRITYVRPSGAGSDSLLLTYGQTGRRSRLWWRNLLDEFGAADVLMAVARLDYTYPGGPVDGRFTARHGPDNSYLGGFTMTAKNPDDLPRMMRDAVRRFDTIYTRALAGGILTPDPSLDFNAGGIDPALQRLIDAGRAADAQERADRADRAARAAQERAARRASAGADEPEPETNAPPVAVNSFTVQFASPDAGAIDATLAAVRATPGVRGATTTSLAIGGTSVLSVSFGGSLSDLAGALRGRGFTVSQGSNALSIRR
ncbi:MAG: heavy-metal-associated domain-containing protein [Pontixanthobacter sp.]